MSVNVSVPTAHYHSLLRMDLLSFIVRSFAELNPQSDLVLGQYVDLLASTLQGFYQKGQRRLIINMPPRMLKSHAASVALPAWILGHDPSRQIICASYGQDLADKMARDCRTLMSSSFYRRVFPHTVLSDIKNSVSEFVTTQGGMRMSTSVAGVLTGRGADIIILDDILKPQEALSEARRTVANEWFFNTLLSRLNSKEKGQILIVMQRLHEDDLVGQVMEREHWDLLSLPAIAQTDEQYLIESPLGYRYFRRGAGEALHPERDSISTYLSIKENIGEYHFQSQFQQSPVSLEGEIVKRDWLRFYDPEETPERFRYLLQSWDTANKDGDLNDYSVCTTWGLYESRFYLLDVYRKKLTYPALKKAVEECWRKFNPTKLLIEDKSSGTSLIQELKRSGVYRIEPYEAPPKSDKLFRFAAQSIKFESGRVLLPRSAPWLDEYIREITGFPGSKHDDQVDSTSQALEFLTSKADSQAIWRALAGHPPEPRR